MLGKTAAVFMIAVEKKVFFGVKPKPEFEVAFIACDVFNDKIRYNCLCGEKKRSGRNKICAVESANIEYMYVCMLIPKN